MKKASCACGQLSITLNSDPEYVLACHCRACQKATGSAFGVSTYWRNARVAEIRGDSRNFTRATDSGKTLTHHFCPQCGGRVYWYAGFYPDGVGVGYGVFDTPLDLVPTDEYWTIRRLPFVEFSCGTVKHPGDD